MSAETLQSPVEMLEPIQHEQLVVAGSMQEVVPEVSFIDCAKDMGRSLLKTAGVAGALLVPASAMAVDSDRSDLKQTMSTSGATVSCGPSTPISRLPVLSLGDRGSCVSYYQRLLVGNRGKSVSIDGVFGPTTKGATAGIQILGNTKPSRVDGVVGPRTWRLAKRPFSRHRTPRICFTPSRNVFCVDKGQLRVRVFDHGRYTKTAQVRLGDFRGASYRTEEGIYKVARKERMSWSNPYKVWLPNAVYFNGGQAIHYSYDFAQNGYNGASHGCVNLRNKGVSNYIFKHAKVHDSLVIVY